VVTCANYFVKRGITDRKTKGKHWEPPFVFREKMKLPHLFTCLWMKNQEVDSILGVLSLEWWLQEVIPR